MSFNYLNQALDQIPQFNNLTLKPGQKALEEQFKIELTNYGPDFNPIMRMKMNYVFILLVHQGLTAESITKMSNQGIKLPLLTTVMLTLVQMMLINKGITLEQMQNNIGLLNELVFTDQQIDRLYLAITAH